MEKEELNPNRKSVDNMFDKERRIEYDITHPKMTRADIIWGMHKYLAIHNITKSNMMYLDDILKNLNLDFGDITKVQVIESFIGKRGVIKPFSTVIQHTKKGCERKDYDVRMLRTNMRMNPPRDKEKNDIADKEHKVYENTEENVHKAMFWIVTTEAIGFESNSDSSGTRMFDSYKPAHVRRMLKENTYSTFMKKHKMPNVMGDYYAFNIDNQLKETYNKLVTMSRKLY